MVLQKTSFRNKGTTGRTFALIHATAHRITRLAQKEPAIKESVDALGDFHIFKNEKYANNQVKTKHACRFSSFFFDINCVIMIKWVPDGQAINQEYHKEVLIKLRKRVGKKTPELCVYTMPSLWSNFHRTHSCAWASSVLDFVCLIPKMKIAVNLWKR